MHDQTNEIQRELERIAQEYHNRATGWRVPPGTYSLFNSAALLHVQGVERALLDMLRRHGFSKLSSTSVLDVGCGSGNLLRRFLEYGAVPQHLTGIDLLPEHIERARRLNPAINWLSGSAHALPFPEASFDLVTTYTMFSSILDDSLRHQVASEMWRVLRPGGLIFVYDFAFDNPRNPAVRGVPLNQVRSLFARPGVHFDARSVTLAPPIARRVAPRSYMVALVLEQLKLFNTHLLVGITVRPDAS